MTSLIVHYDEIGTKSDNRPFFEKQLVRNIRRACPALQGVRIRRLYGRIQVGPAEGLDIEALGARLRDLPGIAWFSEVRALPVDLEALRSAVRDLPLPDGIRRFKVQTRRSNKNFPLDSVQINREIGRQMQERTGWPVDLDSPELTLHIDVTQQGIFLYFDRERGLGGLPVGVSGKLVSLLSGGIDSPVAAFKMFRRGCRTLFVHFHNYGRDAQEVRQKVVRLVEVLARYQFTARLYLVPFSGLQQALVTVVPPEARMVAYRRVMLRIAEPILEKEDAKGFVTGDSVGQVASQTLDNLQVIYRATRYPVFAPLIGEDKRTTTDLARRIGTYDISILPYQDCCSFLLARHPETRWSLEEAESYERKFPLDRYCQEARESAEVLVVG
ncbi:MAG: tRNA 4-thiouridine(8) synthase ThiI [Planctomycetes bacterium]|nr:tRNA 4-thiouridine(8) synthase ThiI [Planctomycetota bacterium]